MRRSSIILLCLVPLALVLSGCTGSITTYKVGDGPTDATIVKVDGDNRPDVVVLNAAAGTLTVWLQGPHGIFDKSYTVQLPKGSKPSAIVSGTFRKDGTPTVVVANRGSDSISIYERLGPKATPVKTVSLGEGAAPAALAVGDVDGDGDKDLLVTSRVPTFGGCPTNGCILVLRDKGDGLAYKYDAYPVGTNQDADYNPVSIAVGQLFPGGRPEFAVVNKGADEAVVIETKGNGFEAAASYTSVDVKSPTAVEISEGGNAGLLAVHGSKGSRVFLTTGANKTLKLVKDSAYPGVLMAGGKYAAYDPSDGQVDLAFPGGPLHEQLPPEPMLKGTTGIAWGEIDGGGDWDWVALKSGSDSIAVVESSPAWAGPASLDLGKVAVGSTGARTVDATVRTAEDLNMRTALTGLDAKSFQVDAKNCGAIHPQGGSCTLEVTFAPTSPGVKHALLTLSSEARFAWGNPTIELTGTATGTGSPAPGPTTLLTGVADDYGKFAADNGASFFSTLKSIGMGTNRMTVLWQPDQLDPTASETGFLDRSIAEAQRQGVRVVLSVYPSSATQHDAAKLCYFAAQLAQRYPYVKEMIVGNEPNKSDFWSPVDPAAYTRLLGQCYDRLHPLGVTVVGGALSARKVGSGMSPVEFIAAMGQAVKDQGRTAPLMDAFSFHPYPNPETIGKGADAGYEWPNAGPPDLDRIKQAVEDAFAARGLPTFSSGLRMVIDEIGWQAAIAPQLASLYTGAENSATVDEAQQAQFYATAIGRIACDPQVSELLLFHLVDEKELNSGATSGGWQSGLLRADLSRRPAFDAVRTAIGSGCTGAARSWQPASSVVGGSIQLNAVKQQVRVDDKLQQGVKFTVGASSDEGVAWKLIVKNGAGTVVATKRGTRTAPFDTDTFTTPILVGSGSYTATMTLTALENGARALTVSKSASSS